MSKPNLQESEGMLFGLIGVAIFSLTLPFTRMAVAELNPVFIALGRAVVAAAAAALLMWQMRAPWPTRRQWPALIVTALGCVVGFPVFTSLAMRYVPAAHGAVVVGILPLAAGIGYAEGGRLSQTMGGQQVISWALIVSMPILLPVTAWLAWHYGMSASPKAWAAFAYVSLFSMFIGFFFWYKGLALGGIARVGQVQLLQPFMTLVAAALLLGETLEWRNMLFALAIIAVVAVGRRMPIRRRALG